MAEQSDLTGLGVGDTADLDDPATFEGDGWGVALVERRNSMISGGVTALEVHWYPRVAERRYGPERYHRYGSIFVTADGIYVRDSALNMAQVPMARWRQMNTVGAALRELAQSGSVTIDWSTTITHQWVRRPEDGGARLIRYHLDPIEPPKVKPVMDKLRDVATADAEAVRARDINSAESVAARVIALGLAVGSIRRGDSVTVDPGSRECAGCGHLTESGCAFCLRSLCQHCAPWNSKPQAHLGDLESLPCPRPESAEPEGR